MSKNNQNLIQKIEFYSIFANNIFLILGVAFFGWTLFETLFLFWLEPLSAILLINYLSIRVPLKYGPKNIKEDKKFQQKALTTIGLTIYTIVLNYIALCFIIKLCEIPEWDTSSVLNTLSVLPIKLWEGSLLFLSVLFLLAYLLPPLMLEKRGIIPFEENMPIQTKIMIFRGQFVANYVWFLVLWILYQLNISNPILLIGVIMTLKSGFEALIFKKVTR